MKSRSVVVVYAIAVKRYNLCKLVKTTTFIRNLYASSQIKEISMKKVTLHISGNVQRVGYRAKVISIANVLGIKGFIQNIPNGRVKIIAQGEQSELDKLIQAINISNSLINVTNIEQEYSTYSDDYEGFNKVVGDGETDERLDNAIDLFKKLITVTEDGFSNLGDKVDQSKIEITSEIHSLRVDFNTLFDTRISKIEYELTEIKDRSWFWNPLLLTI